MNFTPDEIKKRRIRRLAEVIFDHWEEKSGMDTRYFDHPYIHDSYTLYGQSTAGGDYREHVVPRVYLRDRCLEMFENNASINEVAMIIYENLRIVKITPEQAETLNKKYKNTMPEGWTIGKNDPMERLYAVGIQIA